ncbi:PREDICTED: centrosome-associated protein CEP250-like, partial [Dipodomys ordii]|uniref:Centrosome-associated protein CEP250-like n=1 Tax=Dipodomys ordii TaxID=10020 RepID=A0A1S3GVT8_DIPOR
AHHQQETATAQLEQLHQEAKRQEEILTRAVQEKEALVRERAALEVRLQAVERDRQDLTEQLLGLSSAKEQLESSLFEAQQQISVIEVTRGQLEVQIQTITQAKDVIQGEVKCLKLELDTERCRAEQERDAAAQQLAQVEQEGQTALEQQKMAHEEEVNQLIEKW